MLSEKTTQAIAAAKIALAELDLTHDDQTIEALQGEFDEIARAERNATARRREISGLLAKGQLASASAVADSLMAPGGIEPGVSRSALLQEANALDRGIPELLARSRAKLNEIEAVKMRTGRLIGEAIAPLVDALAQDAQETAKAVEHVWAALRAMERSVSIGPAQKARVASAYKGARGTYPHGGLLPPAGTVDVPSEISALFEHLGPHLCFKASIPAQVSAKRI